MLEELNVPCASTEKGLWKLVPDFLLSPHVPFSFADLVLYPFAVINHIYNYLLSPMNPSKSQKLVVVLRNSDQSLTNSVCISFKVYREYDHFSFSPLFLPLSKPLQSVF